MNSYEDPALSHECDLVAERNALAARLAEAERLLREAEGWLDLGYKDARDISAQILAALSTTDQPAAAPRFAKVYCSQCGGEFGPRDSGYSHCSDHEGRAADNSAGDV